MRRIMLFIFSLIIISGQPLKAQDSSKLIEELYSLATQEFYVVRPEYQAVVTRDGEIARIEEAGIRYFDPDVEEVTLYDVYVEKLHKFDHPFEIIGCPAETKIVYRIGDVVHFHATGANDARIGELEEEIEEALGRVSPDSENPGTDGAILVHDLMNDLDLSGLQVLRTIIDLGKCGPQPPRMEWREMPLPPLETKGSIAEFQFGPSKVEVISADNQRVVIDNLVGSYGRTDADKIRTCFGDSDPSLRLEPVNSARIREATGYLNLDEFSGLPQRMLAESGYAEQMMEDCGISLGAIDFSQATVIHRIPINCDESPREPECQ